MKTQILGAFSIILLSFTLQARTIPESKTKAPEIKGANFKAGECASWPMGDKTNTSKINSSVMVGGKAFYILDGIDNKVGGYDATKFDSIATKIPCPTKEKDKK